ncbi:MAG: phosphatase [Halioglobus sp.]|nr:phosphatase [Halioglobus sp.]|tara:strand:+ start:1152 stop:1658 length:507 start_codon:yes stop_codon:yes gene_type:complete
MSTAKTLFGYIVALLEHHTPIKITGDSLDDIYNHLPIDEHLSTSGQPSEPQFARMQSAGYKTVINLAPSSFIENSLADEEAVVTGLGMRYVHIPVNFNNPREQEFDRFVEVMQVSVGEKTWVHCAANARVSAFVFKYRRDVLGEDPALAAEDLRRIWEPMGVWKSFLD